MKREACDSPVASSNPNIRLIRSCISLGLYLGEHIVRDDNPGKMWFNLDGRYSEEECFYFDQETGLATLSTWQTSGHNGSSYGEEERICTLHEANAALISIRRVLESDCLSLMEDRRKAAAAERRELAAKKRLRAVIGDY